ncbi:MAG: enoyl-CoA hydratase [Rhodospirillaceae bacterium]|jgi:enoyl-CoA hydratase/carnithine racemase
MTDEAEPYVLREDHSGICILTLNRPKARNALSGAMIEALSDRLSAIASDTNVRVVILEGAGPVFCSGHDLKELEATTDHDKIQRLFSRCSEVMMQMVRLPQPVIAKVKGLATAAGCQLVATADLAIAGNAAKFATPGVNIGLFCTTPSVAVGRAITRKKAMEMLLTGQPVTAAEAEKMGLINSAVPDQDLDATVHALAKLLTTKSAHILALGKKAFYAQIEKPMAESYVYASAVMAQNMLEEDCSEGLSAFVEKRAPKWGAAH